MRGLVVLILVLSYPFAIFLGSLVKPVDDFHRRAALRAGLEAARAEEMWGADSKPARVWRNRYEEHLMEMRK